MYKVYVPSNNNVKLTVIYDDYGYDKIRFPDDKSFTHEIDAWKHLFKHYHVKVSDTDIFDKLDYADDELKEVLYGDIKKGKGDEII